MADGTVTPKAFARWIGQDFLFVLGLVPFVRSVAAAAPIDDAPGYDGAIAALENELELFRGYARGEGIDLGAEPVAACSEYLAFLDDTVARSYELALTAYYGCERAYLESWSRVRTPDSLAGPYGKWIDNWSSASFRSFVEWLGERLDHATRKFDAAGRQELNDMFARTVSYEISFWDACWRAD